MENRTHYYSGLYYPPALGTAAVIANLSTARMLFYTVLTVAALTLAAFSAVLWAGRSRDRLFLHFGFLCLAFVGTCLYPFLWRWGLNGRLGYAMENTARLLMLFEAVAIAACLADWTDGKAYRRIRPVALALCAACFPCVIFIIPTFDGFINLYGYYSETLFLAGWAALCVCTAGALRRGAVGGAFLAGGCCSLGAGLLANLLNSNRFEPIRGGWQEEYTGFFLVLIFGALMVNYNREVLLKNRQLVTHMEDLVQARTRELHTVLEERKNFFSDMAHNLKAPIAAVHGFISLIREGNLYLDDELREYIRLIESENNEIRHRVQSLSALNAFDRITAPKAPVDVDELLSAVEERNAPDVGVMGVHFSVGRLGRAAVVCAQREKLLTLFENLIYNAIAFTPEGGSITVTPQAEGGTVRITVADSGSGIPPQHLPHIFERFYTTRSGEEGSGLGLYICALTVEELGGTITAESEPGKGAVFVLTLPTQGY